MPKPLNVGVIGCGFMGRTHSNAYSPGQPFLRPRAQARAEGLLRPAGGRRTSSRSSPRPGATSRWRLDWKKLIARTDIDLIDVCVPNVLHHDIVIAAAKAGKMVVCEKPLAMNVARGRGNGRRRREGRRGQHGLVQLPPRAGHLAGQADHRRRPHRPAVPLSGDLQPGLHDLGRRAAGRHGPVAARRQAWPAPA